MSRCYPYPPPGFEKKKNPRISNGEGEAEEPQLELELELGYQDKKAKKKDKKEKEKKHKEKNKDEHRLDTEKSEKQKHKHRKNKKDVSKDKDSDHCKQKNKDCINKVLARDKNGGHAFEDKIGVVDAKDIINKEESESLKFSENIENGKCCKIYPSESEGPVQKVDKERKSEVELRKVAGIGRFENRKCDMIDLSDKESSRQKVDKNKQLELESRKPAGMESLKNGKCNKTDLSNREGSRTKVDKDKKLESRKFAATERHENGKCDKIDLSGREALRKQVEKDKKLEVELKSSAGIERLKDGKYNKTKLLDGEGPIQQVNKDKKLEVDMRKSTGIETHRNGKCDKLDLLAREGSRQNMDKDKKLKVELKCAGIRRLENGKCDEIGKSDRECSRQKVDKGMPRDNDMERDQEILKDRTKSNGVGKKRKEMDTTSSLHVVSIERLENGKCDKLDLSDREGSRQNMNEDKKLEVELKCSGIGRFENGKCDEIGKSVRECSRQKVDKGMPRDNDMERDEEILKDRTKSNGVGKKRKEMDATSSLHVVSIERLENGKCKKIDQLGRQGSMQKLIKEKARDNEIARDKENSKDLAKSEGIRKKRNEMDTTPPSHGNGLWIHLPVLTDKDKRSIKRPRRETTREVYCGNGTTVQEAKDQAFGCVYDSGVQSASDVAAEKCITSACHLPVATKECEQNGKLDCKTISHTFGPSYCNAEDVDAIPSRTRVDNHVQDFNYFYSVPSMMDWSDVDDQAWLFHSNGSKPKAAIEVDHGSNVWAQALHLQPNIYALPYVFHL